MRTASSIRLACASRDLLRGPRGACRRAVRQADRLLRRRPGGHGDRRPAQVLPPRAGGSAGAAERRCIRDRRRPRIAGELPELARRVTRRAAARSSSCTSTAARGETRGRPRSVSSSPTPTATSSRSSPSAIGVATNNVAEYRALLRGLERAARSARDEVEIDQRLRARRQAADRRLQGQAPGMKPAPRRGDRARCAGSTRWQYPRRVPRAQNARADALVNEALDDLMVRRRESGARTR